MSYYKTENSEVYLKIRIKGKFGEIDTEIARNLFSYQMGDSKEAYLHALKGLIDVYKSMADCEKNEN